MKKMKNTISKRILLMLTLAILVMIFVSCEAIGVKEVPTDKEYTFTNPEPELAQPDVGFKIDGIADEEVYKNTKWLYLSNNGEGNNVNIAVTSTLMPNFLSIIVAFNPSSLIGILTQNSPPDFSFKRTASSTIFEASVCTV